MKLLSKVVNGFQSISAKSSILMLQKLFDTLVNTEFSSSLTKIIHISQPPRTYQSIIASALLIQMFILLGTTYFGFPIIQAH